MSACVGILECGPREYCEKHGREEVRLWKAFFGENNAENAAERKRFLEDHQLLMSTQLDEVEIIDLGVGNG